MLEPLPNTAVSGSTPAGHKAGAGLKSALVGRLTTYSPKPRRVYKCSTIRCPKTTQAAVKLRCTVSSPSREFKIGVRDGITVGSNVGGGTDGWDSCTRSTVAIRDDC